VYADESCLGNQFRDRRTPGGAACLVETFRPRRGWVRREGYVSEPDTTNNRMAIRSAIEPLRWLRPSDIVFYSDSQYLVRAMREWVHAWAARGWRRRGGRIENLELWAELLPLARRHRIEWRWIAGHAGHPKNEYVNRLAIRAAERQLQSGGLVPSKFDAWLREQVEQGRYADYLDLPPAEPFRPDPPPPPPPEPTLL
jgi:ribonuclease HI